MPRRSQSTPEEFTAHQRVIAQAVGARIRERRRYLRLTQEQLRIRLEMEGIVITQGQFSRIEHGESLLDITELIALVAVLEVTYVWLLEGKGSQEINV